MYKTRVQNIITVVAVGLVAAAIATANWSAPLSTPPTCNAGSPGCDPPINISTILQTKAGGLQLGGPFIAKDQIISSIPGSSPSQQSVINLFTRDADGEGDFDTNDQGWQITGRGNAYSVVGERNDLSFHRWTGTGWRGGVLVLDKDGQVSTSNGDICSTYDPPGPPPPVTRCLQAVGAAVSSAQQSITESASVWMGGVWLGGAPTAGQIYRSRVQSGNATGPALTVMKAQAFCQAAGDVRMSGGCGMFRKSDGAYINGKLTNNQGISNGGWDCRGYTEDADTAYLEADAICLKK